MSLAETETFLQIPEVQEIGAALKKRMQELRERDRERSQTAKLWLQYLHHIHVLKRFIIAERTSNWSLHLHSTTDMLNLFAASGHPNYAKNAHLSVQQMMSLSEKHPWLHEQFENAKHAVQRSQRYWAGLWSDLVIEQTLMRSVKSTIGLTRDRSMQEGTHHLWVSSLNHLASINNAMKPLAKSSVKRSEEQIHLGPSRLT